jgi:hypothetical protein
MRLTACCGSRPRLFPHRLRCNTLIAPSRRQCGSSRGRSGSGERVVAEVGQDVTGLPDDLAGLGQGGAFAIKTLVGLRVVVVSGALRRA